MTWAKSDGTIEAKKLITVNNGLNHITHVIQRMNPEERTYKPPTNDHVILRGHERNSNTL